MAEQRLQKFLSNAGIASRRRAEDLIIKGFVKINGRRARLGDKVDPQKDIVEFQGRTIKPEAEFFYIAANKPKGYISSRFDSMARKSVYDLIPADLRQKVWTVGRLDYNTEGLILFTNDGELTQALAHPKYEHDKEYEVVVSKEFTDSQLDRLRKGVPIGDRGEVTAPAKVKIRNDKIYMTIHEGKKRQIRRMFEAVGLKVANLKRVRINKLNIGSIPLGKYALVQRSDII